MKKHLPNALRMARVGFFAGVLFLVSETTGWLLRREPIEWGGVLIAIPMLMVLLGAGGLLYGMILSRIADDAGAPAPRAQALAGIGAGTALGALFGVPQLVVGAGYITATFIFTGAITGALIGLLTPNHPRGAASPPPARSVRIPR